MKHTMPRQAGQHIEAVELSPISGVYKITCRRNGRFYIGQSTNIYARWMQHISSLACGNHNVKEMQDDATRYGLEDFQFKIILLCSKDELLKEEQSAIVKEMSKSGIGPKSRKIYNLFREGHGSDVLVAVRKVKKDKAEKRKKERGFESSFKVYLDAKNKPVTNRDSDTAD